MARGRILRPMARGAIAPTSDAASIGAQRAASPQTGIRRDAKLSTPLRKSANVSASNRSVEDAVQAIDSIGPAIGVFILFRGPPRAIWHSLTVAARKRAKPSRDRQGAVAEYESVTAKASIKLIAAALSWLPGPGRSSPRWFHRGPWFPRWRRNTWARWEVRRHWDRRSS